MRFLMAMLIVLIAVGAVTEIWAQAKQTKDEILVLTPKKKTEGMDTKVVFQHKKHAEEYARTCDKCHPPIQQMVDAPENNQDLIHNSCKTCHDKDKPAKTFACNSCHIK